MTTVPPNDDHELWQVIRETVGSIGPDLQRLSAADVTPEERQRRIGEWAQLMVRLLVRYDAHVAHMLLIDFLERACVDLAEHDRLRRRKAERLHRDEILGRIWSGEDES